jgi:predicted nicotinamide N-methyase
VLRRGAVLDVANGSGTVEVATVAKTPKEVVVEDSAKPLFVRLDN